MRNADLNEGNSPMTKKYSSFEDGEVRDEDDYDEYNGQTGGDIKVKQRVSDSEDNTKQLYSLRLLDADAQVDLCYG